VVNGGFPFPLHSLSESIHKNFSLFLKKNEKGNAGYERFGLATRNLRHAGVYGACLNGKK